MIDNDGPYSGKYGQVAATSRDAARWLCREIELVLTAEALNDPDEAGELVGRAETDGDVSRLVGGL